MGLIPFRSVAQKPTEVGLLFGCGERVEGLRVPTSKPVKNRRPRISLTFHSECRP